MPKENFVKLTGPFMGTEGAFKSKLAQSYYSFKVVKAVYQEYDEKATVTLKNIQPTRYTDTFSTEKYGVGGFAGAQERYSYTKAIWEGGEFTFVARISGHPRGNTWYELEVGDTIYLSKTALYALRHLDPPELRMRTFGDFTTFCSRLQVFPDPQVAVIIKSDNSIGFFIPETRDYI